MGTVQPTVKAGSKEVRSLKVFNRLKNVSEQPLAYGKRDGDEHYSGNKYTNSCNKTFCKGILFLRFLKDQPRYVHTIFSNKF